MKIIAEFSSLEEFERFRGSAAPTVAIDQGGVIPCAKAAEAPQRAKAEEPKKEPLKEKKAEAEAQAKQAEAPAVDPTELKALAVKATRAGHRAELKEMLTGYGERSVTDLIAHKPETLTEFKARLEALNAG